jgi:hypothetical protein
MSPISSFLIEKFTLLGFEFQNWMVVAAVAIILFGFYQLLTTRD